jgi:hypothetical protein
MSATWYTWLEQKRPIKVSPGVLDNIARALRLNHAERIQLFQLALRQPTLDSAPRPEKVSPLIERMLHELTAIPAMIVGRRWDVLAWNRAARAFFFDFEQVSAHQRNMLWLIFTSVELRSLIGDWPARAQDTLARFRADYGRHAGDTHFVQLVEQLKSVSPEFALWWPRHDIHPMSEGRRDYHHPVAGRMIVEHITFLVSDSPELRLLMLLPAAQSSSIAKMQKVISRFKGAAGSHYSGRHGPHKTRAK